MILTMNDKKQMIKAGGSLILSAPTITLTELKQLGQEIAKTNGTITVKNVRNFPPKVLTLIASIAPGQIIFDLS